ncbi:MAG: hypothetical protein IKB31_06245 [Bacteroidaceae bacterium]|nr:hypothetical protein [Bacteroidaceae bacterium]
MIKTLKHLLLLLLIAIMAWACNNDKEDTALAEEEPVNLTISMKVPRIELSRGVSDDPRNENNTWNEWEELVDGRKLYHVTLFLIEKTTQRLVGIRDIEYGSEHITDATSEYGANGFSTGGIVDTNATTGTEVTFTFKYDHPRHGACEKLRRGEFLMLAVANHTHCERTIEGKKYEYEGLSNGTDKLENLIESIKSTFDIQAGKGIDNFIQSNANYQSFFDFPIIANNDYLCDKNVPQPLSMVQNISLSPGDNYVSGELKRTYSRIRIEVMNNSSSCDLSINSLTFSDNFAQKQTYLFDNPDNPDRIYTNFKGKPVVTSTYAITNCTATTSNPIALGERSQKVIFDGYILGSKDDNGYRYTLDVEYKDKTYELPASINEQASNLAEIKANVTTSITGETRYFVIKNTSSGKHLYDNGNFLYQGNDIINKNTDNYNYYMWALIERPSGGYYLYNKETEHYVGTPNSNTNGQTRMVTDPEAYYNIVEYNVDYLIQANGNASLCLNNWGGAGTHLGGYSQDNGGKHQFYLAIPGGVKDARYNSPILLETIDPTTAQVNQVKSIKRNDFINVLITVSFDEMNGDFRFEVVPWTEKSGNIEFN